MKHSFYFHSDAGHGWLTVKRKLLDELGVADKVSAYSYQKGKSVYLEEDCDAGLVLNALKEKGIEFEFKERHREYSPIRSYESYSYGGV